MISDAHFRPDRTARAAPRVAGAWLLALATVASIALAVPVHARPDTGRGEAVPEQPLRYGKPLPAPAAGHWRFNVFYGDYTSGWQIASMDYVVEHDGDRYSVRTEGRATGPVSLVYSGLLTQSSDGRIGANGLSPERYAERRGSRAARSVRIDRRARMVGFPGKPPEALPDGMQDRLSALVQLGLVARAQPERLAPGATIEFVEASDSRIDSVGYRSRGDAVLSTAAGPIRALHLERVRSHGEGRTRVDVWLGYDRKLVPVRIRFTENNGRVIDQVIAD